MSIGELLEDTLHERAGRVTRDDDLAERVIRRARGRRGRQAFLGLFTLVVVVVAIVLVIAQTNPSSHRVGPDPRGTAVPSVTSPTPLGSIPGVVTTYRVVQGPPSGPVVTAGAPISLTPRVERRGTATWLVTPTSEVPLPASVNGARSVKAAGTSWVVLTISAGYTGGDTDPGAQTLVVSSSGAVKPWVTDAVRSVAVSPDGTQVASVETVETKSAWSVALVVRRLADGAVVRKVALPYGQPGEWPYSELAWTPLGILASNQSGAVTVAGATVLVDGNTVSDRAPVTGVYAYSATANQYVTVASAGSTCLSVSLASTTTSSSVVCGRIGVITPLALGRVLVQFSESDGTQAMVADTVAGTLTLLTLPAAMQSAMTVGAVAESDTTVLVPSLDSRVWWRWDVVSNTVQTAPLPSGANAAILW